MRIRGQIVLIFAFLLTLIGRGTAVSAAPSSMPPPSRMPPMLQSTQLVLVSPTGCPSTGCAVGQRLNMRFSFEPSAYDAALNPNVKVCVYAPTRWAVPADSVTVEIEGQITRRPYTTDKSCVPDTNPPAGYSLIFGSVAQLEANTFGDALGFGFRLGAADNAGSPVVARLFAQTAPDTWTRVLQTSSAPLPQIITGSGTFYAANDAGVCGTASPCFLNSGEDGAGGLGTGLKDAVDAQAAGGQVVVLGNYSIKSKTAQINKALTLTGQGDSRITFNGPGVCDAPMLSLESAVTLRELNINDGACSNPSRDLIQVNSSETVTIENNDLTGGKDAIAILDNPGADASDQILIRGNAITGNQDYAVHALGTNNVVRLEITANNLHSNRTNGPAVECGAPEGAGLRRANHNYWGSLPSAADTHCSLDPAKRLGMPVALEPFLPGVRARKVAVNETKTYPEAFDNQIALQRTGGGAFDLFVVDHGYATLGGPPFTYTLGMGSPSPCSNYWDVFLPDGAAPGGTLELFLKYDRTVGCQATINSSQYCDQTTTPARYPLYWLDPRGGSTASWLTTGSKIDNNTDGQATSCDTALNEIKVSIDTSGRPGLAADLGYTPLMVGIPIIRTFQPLASSQTVTVTWVTNNEPEIVGFYVWHGPDLARLSPFTELIPRTGSALVGRAYSVRDEGRANGVSFVYRLQVLRADGTSFYSDAVTIVPNQATITPTRTTAPTWTPWPTITPFPTAVPTRQPTRIPTATRPVFVPNATATRLVLATLTPTLDARTPGAQFTATARSRTQAAFLATTSSTVRAGTSSATLPGSGLTGTPISMLLSQTPEITETATRATSANGTATGTPTRTPTPPGTAAADNGGNPWLSLLYGLLAGAAATGGLGGLWYLLRLRPNMGG